MKKPDKLILKLFEVQDLAVKMNRWRTFHKIADTIREAGWELVDVLEGKQKIGEI